MALALSRANAVDPTAGHFCQCLGPRPPIPLHTTAMQGGPKRGAARSRDEAANVFISSMHAQAEPSAPKLRESAGESSVTAKRGLHAQAEPSALRLTEGEWISEQCHS